MKHKLVFRSHQNQPLLCWLPGFNQDLTETATTAHLPKSAMQHVPFLLTKIFLLLRSRCAMDGLPANEKQ